MASSHPLSAATTAAVTDPEANEASPVTDHPPPPRWQQDDPRVRLMCSFGGRIVPRPHDNQLRYVGGDTRIVAVPRHSTFSSLLTKLSKLTGSADIAVKYQLPNEDLDALVSVTSDEDLENMMEEYDRLLSLSPPSKPPRLRLFLFNPSLSSSNSATAGFGSLLDGKRDLWFVDVLNGGAATSGSSALERGRSEVSSVVSEVPDYLFGLDASSDDLKLKTDPSSPASAAAAAAAIPDLPPVKTKPETPTEREPQVPNQTGFIANPVFYVQEPVPVYYVPGGLPVRSMTLPVQYGQPVHHHGPVFVGSAPVGRAGFEYAVAEGYAAGVVPAYPPAVSGEPPGIAGQEMRLRRAPPQ